MAKSSVMLLSSADRKALMEAHERGEMIKDLAPKYQIGFDVFNQVAGGVSRIESQVIEWGWPAEQIKVVFFQQAF